MTTQKNLVGDEVGEFVGVVVLGGKMCLEELAAAADGGAEGFAGASLADAGGDGGDDFVPGFLADDVVDPPVGQDMDPVLEEGDEDGMPVTSRV